MTAWIHDSKEWPVPTSNENGAKIQNFPFVGPGVIRVVIKAGQEIPNHYHNFSHTLVYVAEGEGTVFLEGKDHFVKPGMVIYYAPKQVHGFKSQGKDLVIIAVENPSSTRPDGSRDTVFV